MPLLKACPSFLILLVAGNLLCGCDLFGDESQSLPEGPALVASIDGNAPGLWLFDPETLERTAVVEALRGEVPIGIAFSPDYEHWYLSWSTGSQLDGSARGVLARFDPGSGRLTERHATSDPTVGHSSLAYDPARGELVAYGGGVGAPVKFFDAATFEVVHEQAVGDSNSYVAAAVVALEREKIYFGAATESGKTIHVYDTVQREITRAFSLTEDPVLQRSALSDLALSPDERYLYVTTFLSPGGPGQFYMVDLDTSETVFEGPAGGYSNLAVSPDGRYVFIDCPAGGVRELIPTNQILRFDAQAHEMGVFIDGAGELGLESKTLIADQITMLPDGEAFVIRNATAARIKLDSEREYPSLIKLDSETGDLLATYVPSRDDRGYVTTSVRQLEFGVVPE